MPQQAQDKVTSLLRSTRTAPSAINGDMSQAHRIWSGTQSARLNHSMATVVEPFEAYQIRDLQPAISSYYSPTISTAQSISKPNHQTSNTNADDNSESTPTNLMAMTIMRLQHMQTTIALANHCQRILYYQYHFQNFRRGFKIHRSSCALKLN
jgi:hypothetical protein